MNMNSCCCFVPLNTATAFTINLNPTRSSSTVIHTGTFRTLSTMNIHIHSSSSKNNLMGKSFEGDRGGTRRSSRSSSALHVRPTTGKSGKPASSKEDDIDKTIAIILQNNNSQKQSTTTTTITTTTTTPSKLQLVNILSNLTSFFPFFVFSSAILGIKRPQLLSWVNQGSIIPLMLGAVMTFMGMTLTTDDFTNVFAFSSTTTTKSTTDTTTDTTTDATTKSTQSTFSAVPIGVSCQYIIMPLTAYIIGSILLLRGLPTTTSQQQQQHTAAFLGLILVGCSPGGTASNLVSLIAKADVALSIVLTSVSTLLASFITPLLVKTMIGSTIAISGLVLCKATAQVILGPIFLGMIIRKLVPNIANTISEYAPFAGVILVSLLCGGVVAQNASLFSVKGGGGGVGVGGGTTAGMIMNGNNIISRIIISVLMLHTIGFTMGYVIPKQIFSLSDKTSRTISIETGMQNSALAVVLAKSVILAMATTTTGTIIDPKNTGSTSRAALMSLAMLPGAMSATAHSCLGSALAVYWRFVDTRRSRSNDKKDVITKNNTTTGITTTTIVDEVGGSGI